MSRFVKWTLDKGLPPSVYDWLVWVANFGLAVLAGAMSYSDQQWWAFPVLCGVALCLILALWAQKSRDDIEKTTSQTREAELQAKLRSSAQMFTNRQAELQSSFEKSQAEMIQGITTAAEQFAADTGGSIIALMRNLHKHRTADRKNKDAHIAELVSVQQQLLTSCVETISRWSKLDGLSANWCMRAEDKFSVVVYDKNHLNRFPSEGHSIEPGMVGASTAFSSGDLSLVEDTTDYPAIFSGRESYKCILSCPATRGAKGPSGVIGVVNIDSPTPRALSEDDAKMIADLVSLIGLVEMNKTS